MGNTADKQEEKIDQTDQATIQNGMVDVNIPIDIDGSTLIFIVVIILIAIFCTYLWRRNRCGLNKQDRQIRQLRKMNKHHIDGQLLECQMLNQSMSRFGHSNGMTYPHPFGVMNVPMGMDHIYRPMALQSLRSVSTINDGENAAPVSNGSNRNIHSGRENYVWTQGASE